MFVWHVLTSQAGQGVKKTMSPSWFLPLVDEDTVVAGMPIGDIWGHWAHCLHGGELATAVIGTRGRILGTATPQAIIRHVAETANATQVFHLWPAYTHVAHILPDMLTASIHETPVGNIRLPRAPILSMSWRPDWETAAHCLVASQAPVLWVYDTHRCLVGKVTAQSLWTSRPIPAAGR